MCCPLAFECLTIWNKKFRITLVLLKTEEKKNISVSETFINLYFPKINNIPLKSMIN